MNKAGFMNMKNDCIQSYRNGVLAAKSVEIGSGLTPKSLYMIVHPHICIIDNIGHSPEYNNAWERIL